MPEFDTTDTPTPTVKLSTLMERAGPVFAALMRAYPEGPELGAVALMGILAILCRSQELDFEDWVRGAREIYESEVISVIAVQDGAKGEN